MTVHEGDKRIVDLQKKDNRSFVPQVIIEARFDLMPHGLSDSIVNSPTSKDKGGEPNHAIGSQHRKGSPKLMTFFIEVLHDDLFPITIDGLISSKNHIESTEFYHFLKADHHKISFFYRKIE